MNRKYTFAMAICGAAILFTGCQTLPPGAEPGPHGTMAYDVLIEASEPGAKIEANGEVIGTAPLHLKIYGDADGTFHDFGSPYYVINALPLTTNQYSQTRVFGTGQWFGPPEDRIPKQVYFDMNKPPPAQTTVVYPGGYPAPYPYYYPYYGFYGPYWYGRPYYYYGGGYYHHHGGSGFQVYPSPNRGQGR